MEPIRKKILIFHIWGAIFTILAGSFCHFIYGIGDYFKPLAIIGAVNESTWEHLKIAFWPTFFFAVVEYFAYGKSQSNFWVAKAKQIYVIPILIPVFFYGYTAVIKDNLFSDIFIFVLAIIIGYAFSYKILTWQRNFLKYKTSAIIFIILAGMAFGLFTFFPPKIFLFLDPVTGLYGIIR